MTTKRFQQAGRVLAMVAVLTFGAANLASPSDGAPAERTKLTEARAQVSVRSEAGRTAPLNRHFFSSPTKNIGCYVISQEARCDIAHHSWHAPRRPASCQADWGNGLYLRSKSHWVCASDTVLGARRILHYGDSERFGAMKCTSRRTGMACRNLNTGHGFRLARDTFSRF